MYASGGFGGGGGVYFKVVCNIAIPIFNYLQLNLLHVVSGSGFIVSSDVYLLLEQKCIDGTRAESKYAFSAIASLIQSPDDMKFAKLCKVITSVTFDGLFDS